MSTFNQTTPAKQLVIICPGFHEAQLTDQFVRSLPPFIQPQVVDAFPADPLAVFRWLSHTLADSKRHQPIIAIGFSAGVVGLAGALSLWQQQGGSIAHFFALDGWGVPLLGLPISRLSHDGFTHWSTLPLGAGKVNFYADPAVDHLRLWGNPEQVSGWQVGEKGDIPITAADFLRQQLSVVSSYATAGGSAS
ncbi:MAG: hypothetical protein WBD47_05410 [Phormidesmis sp.]